VCGGGERRAQPAWDLEMKAQQLRYLFSMKTSYDQLKYEALRIIIISAILLCFLPFACFAFVWQTITSKCIGFKQIAHK